MHWTNQWAQWLILEHGSKTDRKRSAERHVRSGSVHRRLPRRLAADKSHKSVRDVVARAVSDPAAVLKELGEPKRAEVQKLYQSSDLTILNVIWAPRMTIMPHNHQMWAVIGIYTGREDNIFWRRIPGDQGGS